MSGISHIGSIMNMMGISKDLSPNLMTQITGTAGTGLGAGFGTDQVTVSPLANMMQQFLNMEMKESGKQDEIDLGGLAQLKQRGDMLATMLQTKLKNFESGLMAGLKNAGIDSNGDMSFKNGDNGLFLLNDLPNKAAIENQLKNTGPLQEQFKEISQMAKILEMLDNLDTNSLAGTRKRIAGASPMAQYAQQSQLNRPEPKSEAAFVVNVIDGNASYTFE